MHGNLKLGVHGTPLAQDMAGRQPRKQFLGLKVPEGREEARGRLVPNTCAQPEAPHVQCLCSGVHGVPVLAHVDHGAVLPSVSEGADITSNSLTPLHSGLIGRCPCNRRYEIPVLPRVPGRVVDKFRHEFHERALGTSGRSIVDEREGGHEELLVPCEADTRLEPRNVVIQRRNLGTGLIILDTQKLLHFAN